MNLTAFQELFPESQSIENFEFSNVHKVVLNIFPLKLERMLMNQTWRCQIDSTDAWGRSPLHWAIRRNDVAAAENLLWAGAHIDLQDCRGCAPIHLAAKLPDTACLQLLLKYHADVAARDVGGAEPIHWAAATGVPHLQALLNARSSIESKDGRGGTPFNWAAQTDHVEVGRYLVAVGANKNNADEHGFGNSPLFAAISSHQCDFLEMLLDAGVNMEHKNHGGSTLLHWTARWGDVRTVKLLATRKEQLRTVDPAHRDTAGKTARNVLDNRTAVPDLFADEFEKLISGLEDLRRGTQAALSEQTRGMKQRLLGIQGAKYNLPHRFWLAGLLLVMCIIHAALHSLM